jgi:hypothetical protein
MELNSIDTRMSEIFACFYRPCIHLGRPPAARTDGRGITAMTGACDEEVDVSVIVTTRDQARGCQRLVRAVFDQVARADDVICELVLMYKRRFSRRCSSTPSPWPPTPGSCHAARSGPAARHEAAGQARGPLRTDPRPGPRRAAATRPARRGVSPAQEGG